MIVDGRHRRNDFEVAAEEGEHNFSVFLRQSIDFPENFSVGLTYESPEEHHSICLLRCNGPHGDHANLPSEPPHHFRFHLHLARNEAMEAGIRTEFFAEETDSYATFEEAVVYFVGRCGILDTAKYFAFLTPELNRQLALFEDQDE